MDNEENINKETNDKKNELSQPHDLAFKKLFGEVNIARDVIEKNLPKEVLDKLDMDSLEKLDGSFISKKFKETFTDLLYGVRINNREVYVAFLWEHKSYKDKLVAFQVAGYIIDIWKEMIKNNKKELPVVIPIVVYHGEGKWNYKTDIRQLIPDFEFLPDYLKQMLPAIKHEFVNITDHTDEDIKKYEPITRLIIRVFKYVRAPKDKLLEVIIISVDEAAEILSTEELAYYMDLILLYLSATNKDFTEADIRTKIRELDGRGSEIMTILQEREQKGIEIGKQEGIELGKQEGIELGKQEGIEEGEKKARIEMVKNLLNEGAEIELISKISKMSKEHIEEIRKEI